ncbi:MAG TPA: hypothetical protein VI386_31210, partial [Candidatus Sulfotelmatobacter sp.]
GRKTRQKQIPSGMTTKRQMLRQRSVAGDGLDPTHRKVAMDGAPDLLWLLEGRQDRSRSLPG